MKTTNDIYQMITDKMISELENGMIPWQKPWQNATNAGCISHTTGKPYSMINQILLGDRAGEWLTYKQVVNEGGKVRKGEKASFVVFWQMVEKVVKSEQVEEVSDDESTTISATRETVKHYPVLKSYNVFHIDQCDGIKPRFENKAKTYDHTPIEVADEIVNLYAEREQLKVNICDSNRAFYSPVQDFVQVPKIEQYAVKAEYYSTLFHELTHSTGHAKRLSRPEVTGLHFFGDANYSKEELTAEMGAAFLCNRSGIDCAEAFRNSVAYIQGWLKALHNDRKLVVLAAAKAERAANYILTGEK